MNIKIARKIAMDVVKLAEEVGRFQATYGRSYQVTEDSPVHAQELHASILRRQKKIARRLDVVALQNPFVRYGKWWEELNVIDSVTVDALASEVFRLVSACAYVDEEKATQNTKNHTIENIQSAIAGMLHPRVRVAGE